MSEQEQNEVNLLFTKFVEVAGVELKALRHEVETLKAEIKEVQQDNEALTERVGSLEYQLNPPTD